MSQALVLAGDVGGTTTRLALYRPGDGDLRLVAVASFRSRDHPALSQLARSFLEGQQATPGAACFGVPGPVVGGRCRTTNLPWEVDEADLAAVLGVPSRLLNDLEAAALGVAGLAGADLMQIKPGRAEPAGTRALIAPGTGLGEAGLVWDGREHRPLASEGGHATFGPAGDLQARLHRHLEARFGHVSWERVVSGPGLVNIYEFFLEESGPAGNGRDLLRGPDPAAAISRAALAGEPGPAASALDLWVALLGSEAGNLTLKLKATGGVYVGGGIAPQVRSLLQTSAFARAFTAKGRMQALLERVPVHLILNERVALLGAARHGVTAAI